MRGKNVITDYPLTGIPLGSYTHSNFTYSSTIDSYTDLYAKYCYDAGYTNLPIRVLLHGWSQDTTDISTSEMNAVALASRCFVLVVGMRGRDGASGSRDASARELYDIYDAIQYVKTNFSTLINPENVIMSGYSGGGGNTLGFCCKFPDLPVMAVDYCGISDYAYGVNNWDENSSYDTGIEIGSDAAYARYAVYAITNYECLSYPLIIYHGSDDTTVLPNQSTMINAAFAGEEYTEIAGYGHITFFRNEDDYKNRAINIRKESIGTSGTFKILGYIKTELFEIWLGDGDEEVADLSYNTATDSYTITPQTGSMDVVITQADGKTASQTITEETIITVT